MTHPTYNEIARQFALNSWVWTTFILFFLVKVNLLYLYCTLLDWCRYISSKSQNVKSFSWNKYKFVDYIPQKLYQARQLVWRRFCFRSSYNISQSIIQVYKWGIIKVLWQLGVISKVSFCADSESSHRVGPSHQNFERIEVK